MNWQDQLVLTALENEDRRRGVAIEVINLKQ